MKGGGGAKRNASLEQGVQVSMATQRALPHKGTICSSKELHDLRERARVI